VAGDGTSATDWVVERVRSRSRRPNLEFQLTISVRIPPRVFCPCLPSPLPLALLPIAECCRVYEEILARPSKRIIPVPTPWRRSCVSNNRRWHLNSVERCTFFCILSPALYGTLVSCVLYYFSEYYWFPIIILPRREIILLFAVVPPVVVGTLQAP